MRGWHGKSYAAFLWGRQVLTCLVKEIWCLKLGIKNAGCYCSKVNPFAWLCSKDTAFTSLCFDTQPLQAIDTCLQGISCIFLAHSLHLQSNSLAGWWKARIMVHHKWLIAFMSSNGGTGLYSKSQFQQPATSNVKKGKLIELLAS